MQYYSLMKCVILLKSSITVGLLVVLSGVAGLSQALPVTGLYNQEVAVGNESNSERERAFGEALTAVIVKVTGERRWLEEPIIADALRSAQNYVEGFDYRTTVILTFNFKKMDFGEGLGDKWYNSVTLWWAISLFGMIGMVILFSIVL